VTCTGACCCMVDMCITGCRRLPCRIMAGVECGVMQIRFHCALLHTQHTPPLVDKGSHKTICADEVRCSSPPL
jgi:hypothetical protein